MILEDACEMIDRFINGDGWVCINPQYEAGGEIAHSERETIVAILQTELPLIICGPNVIRALGYALRASRMSASIPASWFHQPVSCKNACCCCYRWEIEFGIPALEKVE